MRRSPHIAYRLNVPHFSRVPYAKRVRFRPQGAPRARGGTEFDKRGLLFKPPHGDGDRRHEVIPSDRLDEIGQNRVSFHPLGE